MHFLLATKLRDTRCGPTEESQKRTNSQRKNRQKELTRYQHPAPQPRTLEHELPTQSSGQSRQQRLWTSPRRRSAPPRAGARRARGAHLSLDVGLPGALSDALGQNRRPACRGMLEPGREPSNSRNIRIHCTRQHRRIQWCGAAEFAAPPPASPGLAAPSVRQQAQNTCP